ncbi:type 2 isopentenyl-diphosphate Delta-isomerase [Cohnella abietis]|uniref:type 2 isopentenyl-diphosphate Delta-isomerase n=1 Tax=Cohnella abietis TaxID=2507935 RepID=UPI002F947325
MERRKKEHIEICLQEDVTSKGGGTGFQHYRFRHRALPEIDYAAIDTSTNFVGRAIKVPLMISSMTGGTEEAARINIKLAEAAEKRGWAMGLGSLRAAIEQPATAASYQVRTYAPNVPLIANIGAVQLNYGFGIEQCRRAVELSDADALVLHLNGLQEVFQEGGNSNFGGLLRKIEQLCKVAEFPVGVKEVGWGIDGVTARALKEAGVSFIDVAGSGGTSWSQVEKFRSTNNLSKAAAEAFADWGTPTAQCVVEVSEAATDTYLIASGGLVSGVDAAKAIALGANMASFGRALLAPAVHSEAELNQLLERLELELRIAMFGIGAANLQELHRTNRIVQLRAE